MNKIVFKAVTDAAQRREELSKESERVELASVQELKSFSKRFLSIEDSAVNGALRAANDMEQAGRMAKEGLSMVEDIEKKAKEIGADSVIREISAYKKIFQEGVRDYPKWARTIKSLN